MFFKKKKENAAVKESITQKFMKGLTKTSSSLAGAMTGLFTGYSKVDEDLYEELEEILIGADVGVTTTMELVSQLRHEVKERKIKDPAELQPLLVELIRNILIKDQEKNEIQLQDGLTIVLFVGVNGVGKTTSIGKARPSI